MPFFPDAGTEPGPRLIGRPDASLSLPEPSPSAGDVLGAAGIRQNLLVAGARYLRDRTGYTPDPSHNPLDVIAGTRYEAQYLDNFINSSSEAETRAIMRRIDEEEAARQTIEKSGGWGVLAEIGAGLADPTIFLPGTVFLKAGRAGWAIGRFALGVGGAAALQAGAQEAGLYATQETRTPGEVMMNVGTATLLGGLLGAGAGAIVGRAERKALEAAMDVDRRNMAADLTPKAAGAAATDTRELKLQSYYLDKLPGLRAAMARVSPTMRIFSSDFVAAKRALADLAETPLRFEENAAGGATTQGPALDRSARMATQRALAQTGAKIDELYARYRFGQGDRTFLGTQVAKARGALQRAPDKMAPLEFREAIGKAMRRADSSDVPEVQEAARFIREQVFEPWKERAIKAGLLDKDVQTSTAESYFMRVYNKTKIDAARPEFQGRIADWLTREQEKKAAIKGRLTELSDRMDELQGRIEKADATTERAAELQAEYDGLMRQIEEQVVSWKGKSSWEAARALEKRAATEADRAEGAPRLQSADKAVGKAVRRLIEADTDLSPQELRARAGEIVDRISVAPDGRLAYDAASGGPAVGWHGEGAKPRGPLASRDFQIPDSEIEDFLVNDVEDVIKAYTRSIIPDVLLTERFGDVDMTQAFKALREEHEAKALAAKTDAARSKLRKEYEAVVMRLAAIRDRVRNVYMMDAKMRNLGRATAAVKTWNMLSDLGGVTITSLSDVAGPIFLHGFTKVLGDGWRPFFKSLTGIRNAEGFVRARAQYKAMGLAVETLTASRMNEAYGLVDIYRPMTRAERALGAVSDAYFVATGLGPWTDLGKTITSVVSGNEILRAAKAVTEGKATAKQIESLAASGMDPAMAGRIWKQFEKGGEIIDGTHVPNTADWTDRGAREAFEGAVGREADIAIITPGQEKPLWMSHPIAGLLGQYKAFTAGATERYLIAGLQRSDAAVLSGLTAAIGAGMISYGIYQVITGRAPSENPADWVREGISRSGVLGWFEEANGFTSKFGIDAYSLMGSKRPLSRYASRTAVSQLLGPTFGKMEGMFDVAGDVANGTWSDSDTRRLRRMLAFQNLFYVRWLIDQAEAGVNAMIPDHKGR